MENFERVIDDVTNGSLCDVPSEAEIKSVVFTLNKDASAGTDGFTALFYQFAWGIIKDDFVDAVIDYFKGSLIPKGFSHTSIALIPKVDLVDSWPKFRPISLCSCFDKVISKLLNDRLTPLLPGLISKNQSGFLPGI